jgi:putative resolvase
MSKLTISEAAKLKGVAASTLRRWETEGKLIPNKAELSYTIGYCRVSSHEQKDDLTRQDI